MDNVQICNVCIMDSTIPGVTFDENGVCSCCREYEEKKKRILALGTYEERKRKLDAIIKQIKKDGEGKQFDCVVGISGGVDSSYVMMLCKDYGLRPYAIHVDNGWNAEVSNNNLKRIMEKLDIPLHIVKPDQEEFTSLQRSFLYASTPHCEHPTDHALLGVLYKAASDLKIRYYINGSNFSSEGVGVSVGVVGQRDWKYIKSVQKQFGTVKLKTYPHVSLWDLFKYKIIDKQITIVILDYLDYSKEKAIQVLQDRFGWEYYGGKHYESIYTRFFQAYILPEKFHIDKRKAHYSALIKSGQMTRDDALKAMELPAYDPEMYKQDRGIFLKKLNLTEEEFDRIMKLPIKKFEDYPSYTKSWYYKAITKLYFVLKPLLKM